MNTKTINAIKAAIEAANFSKLFEDATGFTPEEIEEEDDEPRPLMFNVETNELFIMSHNNVGVAIQQNPWVLCSYISAENIMSLMNQEISDFVEEFLRK